MGPLFYQKGVQAMERRFLDVRSLSAYLGIKPQTIYNKISRGNFPIPFRKVFERIRFDSEDVEHYIGKLPLHQKLNKN
jgi:predicted DNA-binding transcriptional regulator AlpA